MNIKAMQRLTKHYDTYLGGADATVLHPVVSRGTHVDVLLYPPNDAFPFYKLCTMGAADCRMKSSGGPVTPYLEYMLFVPAEEPLHDDAQLLQFYSHALLRIATYAEQTQTTLSWGHLLEWGEESGTDTVGAFFVFPEILQDARAVHCKLGPLKTVTCLQALLLTREQTERLMHMGPGAFADTLYPEGGTPHFLSRRYNPHRG